MSKIDYMIVLQILVKIDSHKRISNIATKLML